MLRRLVVKGFKSLEDVDVELGQVNVFVGANGSGKSNLLEAIGVLGAAAEGKVTEQSLKHRGVRPGLPQIYKSAFRPRNNRPKGAPEHIRLEGHGDTGDEYSVSLWNPLNDPHPAWTYKHESWKGGNEVLVSTSPASKSRRRNKTQGFAALKMVEVDPGLPAARMLEALQRYVIYSPTTPILRGTAQESEPVSPIGLSGGMLPDAVRDLLALRRDKHIHRICDEALELMDWAEEFMTRPSADLPLSATASVSPRVVAFRDRFMMERRNVLSGFDASEGALYVLFMAILAGHPQAPRFCAVDNADHGLNPRLARSLVSRLCGWLLDSPLPRQRQMLITTHNPLVLDGLPLQDDRVRLFTVSRTSSGRTAVGRIALDETLQGKGREGWTLSRLWVMGHLGGVPDV